MDRFDNEMMRYGAVITDEGNPVARLGLSVTDQASADYLEARAGSSGQISTPRSSSNPRERTTVHGLLIASPAGTPLPLSAEALNTAARERWGHAATVRSESLPTLATSIWVEVEGQPFFQIDLQRALSAISCDGNDDQTADVAVWVRSLLPADAPRIIATDESFSCHVVLVPGITVEQFRGSVIDHSVPGWSDGDPDLG